MSRTSSIICALWLALFQASISGQNSAPNPIRVTGRVVRQGYCYGDVDVFSMPMTIDLRITNLSKKPYYTTSDLAPVSGRVATSLEEAQHGDYIVQWNPTRYPRDGDKSHPITRLRPGSSTVIHTGYTIVARFKSTPSIPGTVPPGKYVLQLDLRAEDGFAEPSQGDDAKGRVVALKTEPISFEIPTNVNPPECKSGGH
jgi:hypothetical protein